MTKWPRRTRRNAMCFSYHCFWRVWRLALYLARLEVNRVHAANSPCRVEPADYKGWHAQKLSNHWVELMVLPQNGGRLVQVIFAGHPYLFVNPEV